MLGPGVGDGVIHRRGARVPGALEPGAGEAALVVVGPGDVGIPLIVDLSLCQRFRTASRIRF